MAGWKKMLGIFATMNGVGCGVSLFLQCGLGSDPIGLLCDGIRHTLDIQFGHASLLYNALLIMIAMLIAKKNMGVGTVVYAAFSGYFIDFYNWLLQPLQLINLNFLSKIQLYLVGQLFFSAALTILIKFRLGMNALDAVLYRAEAATNIPYIALRTGCDVLYVIIGFSLGGIFGVGTVISVLTTGLFVGIFTRIIENWKRRNSIHLKLF